MKTLRGFSLIELIVGMAILGILMSIGIPAFSDWMRNARVRTTAESVLNGLQLARAEAVRRNTTVGLYLVTTTTSACALSTAGPNWIVSFTDPTGECATPPHADLDLSTLEDDDPRIIQAHSSAESSGATIITAVQPSYLFTGLGRLNVTPASDDEGVPGAILFESATGGTCGTVRCLKVSVSLGGQIRMCDPALPTGDTQAC